ncbi:hypothetical protein PRIPAC_79815 [Pristionchus pacificus]|uniref:ADP ribosylation factor n=1 Tax=Pristionchus pacificus TaxID=54126 RepID=A0A2A6CQ49_PRIPA|nr:hypothetical protein PRIPAC_79815 [Pristionchus pacificus]|eukprot:PDM80161.1 ADP ribosylation factor [Pristionchus pacificus]
MGQAVCTPRNRSIDYGRPDTRIVTDAMSNSPTVAVILHMTGFSEHEMRSFHKNLRYNVFQKIICQFSEGLSCYRGITNEAEEGILLNFLDLHCVRTFMELYPNYASLPDNAHYYLPQLAELLSPDHVPTAEDILHLRIPTTSVNEIIFSFSNSSIRLIDVGGQRTYRKKWIHCFDGVTAVLFVVSMAAYDQSLDEADTMITPVLHDDIIPLATKKVKDLFEKKVLNTPLNKYFRNYEGSTTEEASEFLKEHFLKRKSKKDIKRAIYSHYTCATDTKNVEFVFKAACDIVFQNNLHSQGM